MNPFLWHFFKGKTVGQEVAELGQGQGRGEEKQAVKLPRGRGASLQGDGNIPILDCGDGCTHEYPQTMDCTLNGCTVC